MNGLDQALSWAKHNAPPTEGKGYSALARAMTDAGFPTKPGTIMRWVQRGRVPKWQHRLIELTTEGEVSADSFNGTSSLP